MPIALTNEALPVARKGERLRRLPFAKDAEVYAAQLCALVANLASGVGVARAELERACEELDAPPALSPRIVLGLRQSVVHACAAVLPHLEVELGARRLALHEAMTAALRSASPQAQVALREQVLSAEASRMGLSPERLDAECFADVRDETYLRFEGMDAGQLLRHYHRLTCLELLGQSFSVSLCAGPDSPAALSALVPYLEQSLPWQASLKDGRWWLQGLGPEGVARQARKLRSRLAEAYLSAPLPLALSLRWRGATLCRFEDESPAPDEVATLVSGPCVTPAELERVDAAPFLLRLGHDAVWVSALKEEEELRCLRVELQMWSRPQRAQLERLRPPAGHRIQIKASASAQVDASPTRRR